MGANEMSELSGERGMGREVNKSKGNLAIFQMQKKWERLKWS
jgi:hypothetical protein